MKRKETYIVGKENKPEWFTNACKCGKIKIINNEEEYKLLVFSGMSTYEAFEGDIIIKTVNGLVVKKNERKVINAEEGNDIS